MPCESGCRGFGSSGVKGLEFAVEPEGSAHAAASAILAAARAKNSSFSGLIGQLYVPGGWQFLYVHIAF